MQEGKWRLRMVWIGSVVLLAAAAPVTVARGPEPTAPPAGRAAEGPAAEEVEDLAMDAPQSLWESLAAQWETLYKLGGRTMIGQTIAIQNSGTLCQGSGGPLQWGATVGPPLLADEIFASPAGSLSRANFQPKPGRKITSKGASMDWMYIDRWYCIGPFPNPGLCVNPCDVDKYAIYYFRTEVWSEEEKDYRFALGGDDYGKPRVNGELIWASGKTPHHWIPDRGCRKVKLRKGPNQMLFKLENAGGAMGFSLVIRIAPIGT